jgi:predicted Rossmann-fold nucleotide-binding protein
MITIPIGIPPGTDWGASFSKVGITKGGGGVKVGNLVGGNSMMNCAARVGSMVGVVRGVGVGGGSTIGMLPEIDTSGEYTQPVLSCTPG